MSALITDLSKLNKAIDSIASRAKKLDADIQVAGLSAIQHIAKCGDIGPINRLFLALGAGHRKSALTSWLLAYAPVKANDGESKKEKPFVNDTTRPALLEQATQDPWFEHKPEPAPDEVFDVRAAVAAILKKAMTRNVADGKFVEALQSFLETPVTPDADPLDDAEE